MLPPSSPEKRSLTADAERFVASLVADIGSTDPAAEQRLVRQLVPRWHFFMLNDEERNGAFEDALRAEVRPEHTVLDIGAGTGLLAMMAVRAGAKRVVTCESSLMMADIARRIIARNGMADAIEVIALRSDQLDATALGGRADVIVSETFDCGLLGESLLATMRHARAELLASDGVFIPTTARIVAMLFMSNDVTARNRVDHVRGFDVSHFNTVATASYFPLRLWTVPSAILSERVEVVSLDFGRGNLDPSTAVHHFPVVEDGVCHGVAFWFDIGLSPGIRLENSPENTASNWHQAIQLFDDPPTVARGDLIPVEVAYDDSTIGFALHR